MRKTRLVILPGARSLTQMCCLLLYLSCPGIGASCREQLDLAREDLYSQNIREIYGNKDPFIKREEVCSIAKPRIDREPTNLDFIDGQRMCSDPIHKGWYYEDNPINNSSDCRNIEWKTDINEIQGTEMTRNENFDLLGQNIRIRKLSARSENINSRANRREMARNGERSRNRFVENEIRTTFLYERQARMEPDRRVIANGREFRIMSRAERNARETSRRQVKSNRNNEDVTRSLENINARFSSEESFHRHPDRRIYGDNRKSAIVRASLKENSIGVRMFRKSVESRETRIRNEDNRRINQFDRDTRRSIQQRSLDQQINSRRDSREFFNRRMSEQHDIRRRPVEGGEIRFNRDDRRVNSYDDRTDGQRYLRKLSREAGVQTESEREVRFGTIYSTSRQGEREDRSLKNERVDRRDLNRARDLSTSRNEENRRVRLNFADKMESRRYSRDVLRTNQLNRDSFIRRNRENFDERVSQMHHVASDLELRRRMNPYGHRQVIREKLDRDITLNTDHFRIAHKDSVDRERSRERSARRTLSAENKARSIQMHSRSLSREKRSTERLDDENPEFRHYNDNNIFANRNVLREVNRNVERRDNVRLNRKTDTVRPETVDRHHFRQNSRNDRRGQLLSEYHRQRKNENTNDRKPTQERLIRRSVESTFSRQNNARNSERFFQTPKADISSPMVLHLNQNRQNTRAEADRSLARERITSKGERSLDRRTDSVRVSLQREKTFNQLSSRRDQSRMYEFNDRTFRRIDPDRRRLTEERSFNERVFNRDTGIHLSSRRDMFRGTSRIENRFSPETVNRIGASEYQTSYVRQRRTLPNTRDESRKDFSVVERNDNRRSLFMKNSEMETDRRNTWQLNRDDNSRRSLQGIEKYPTFDKRFTQRSEIRSNRAINNVRHRSIDISRRYVNIFARKIVELSSATNKNREQENQRASRTNRKQTDEPSQRYTNTEENLQNTRRILVDRRLNNIDRQKSEYGNFQKNTIRVSSRNKSRMEPVLRATEERLYNRKQSSTLLQTRRNIRSTNYIQSVRISEKVSSEIRKNNFPPMPRKSEINLEFNELKINKNGFNTSSKNELLLQDKRFLVLTQRKQQTTRQPANLFDKRRGSDDAVPLGAEPDKGNWNTVTAIIRNTFSFIWEMKEETKAACIGGIAFMMLTPGVK